MTRVLTLDLETGDADSLFTGIVRKPERRPCEGPYIRLSGYAVNDDPVVVTTDVDELLDEIKRADVIQGHNLFGFDGLALAWHHGMDWESFCAKAVDSEIRERYRFPARSREKGSADKYDLDHTAMRLGVTGKITGPAGLQALKNRHGGYDRIPVDDPDFIAYLVADVEAARAVAARYPAMTPYEIREHKIACLFGRMTLNGFHVNEPLLRQRISEGQEAKAAALRELNEVYGVPLTRPLTRGRGENKVTTQELMASPLSTNIGRDALIKAFHTWGAKFYPRTAEGKIALGRDAMKKMATYYHELSDVVRICELVTTVTTTRTVYQTAADWLCPDGKVHPRVSMRQSSGRASITGPGMTVYGKHNGRWREREIFDADDDPEVECVVITCDLSQVDMRAVAGHCQDKNYMSMFAPGRDFHSEVAKMLGVKRQESKPLGHGSNYGMGDKRMIRDGHDPKLVRAFFDLLAREFPRKGRWTREIVAHAARGGMLDNGFGRPMRCDPKSAYTVAPALMGQGAARDITCEVLIHLMDRHPEYLPYLRGHAHDEFIFVVPADQVDVIGKEIEDAFTWEWRNVPILCDLSPVGKSWGACSQK